MAFVKFICTAETVFPAQGIETPRIVALHQPISVPAEAVFPAQGIETNPSSTALDSVSRPG